MRTWVGKIARLPGSICNELNRRLRNGALGKDFARWLNALPEVIHVLAERFPSRPITEDNPSEWRCGGFQDWLREKERRVRLPELTAEYHDGDAEEHAARPDAQPWSGNPSFPPKSASPFRPIPPRFATNRSFSGLFGQKIEGGTGAVAQIRLSRESFLRRSTEPSPRRVLFNRFNSFNGPGLPD
jgi:hypothetical protein